MGTAASADREQIKLPEARAEGAYRIVGCRQTLSRRGNSSRVAAARSFSGLNIKRDSCGEMKSKLQYGETPWQMFKCDANRADGFCRLQIRLMVDPGARVPARRALSVNHWRCYGKSEHKIFALWLDPVFSDVEQPRRGNSHSEQLLEIGWNGIAGCSPGLFVTVNHLLWMEHPTQVQIPTCVSIFWLQKFGFVWFAGNGHLAPAADRGDTAIEAESMQERAMQRVGHRGLDSCSPASESVLCYQLRCESRHTRLLQGECPK
jgi:hypothetical protein